MHAKKLRRENKKSPSGFQFRAERDSWWIKNENTIQGRKFNFIIKWTPNSQHWKNIIKHFLNIDVQNNKILFTEIESAEMLVILFLIYKNYLFNFPEFFSNIKYCFSNSIFNAWQASFVTLQKWSIILSTKRYIYIFFKKPNFTYFLSSRVDGKIIFI